MAGDERAAPVALTRTILLGGAGFTVATAGLAIGRSFGAAGVLAFLGAALLLVGGRRAHRGAGAHAERMLDALLDRLWDGIVLGAIAWATRDDRPSVSVAALGALGGSFLSSYIRARGASLGYAVEEGPLTRGLRYGLVAAGLLAARPLVPLWTVAAMSALAALIRSSQVLKEEWL